MQKIAPKQPTEKQTEPTIVKEMEPMRETKVTIQLPLVIGAVAIILTGAFSGYVLAQVKGGRGAMIIGGGTTAGGLKKVVGIQDEKTFKDSAEGVLREGGVDGEGSHHLERPGGPSQNVYLTSSTVSLDDYIGKQVKVLGETFDAEKAGWLMDVGRLELME